MQLDMTLLETLRLYTPVLFLNRKTASDTNLANIRVEKGTVILIPLAMMHRDKEVWGLDVDEFNPMRFNNKTSKAAKYANSLLAFSWACSGQNFAMTEVQTVIVMMLKRFSFTLSPKYVHKPTNFLTLTPRYGLPLIVKKL
jgi:PHYB activation tagged suppressor 1